MEDNENYHKRMRSMPTETAPRISQVQLQRQQQRDEEAEEREEDDKRMTSLGSIIQLHKRVVGQENGEIIRTVFKTKEIVKDETPTFFSFI